MYFEVRYDMFPSIKYLLFLLFFVLAAVAFAADSCIAVVDDVPNLWDSVGLERMVVNGNRIELSVFKNVHETDFSGTPVIKFRKRDSPYGLNIMIDSLVYPDGSNVVEEHNGIMNFIKYKNIDGVLLYTLFNEKNEIVEMYEIGQKEEELKRTDGFYSEIRGDTAFWNLNYQPPE